VVDREAAGLRPDGMTVIQREIITFCT
jgi:hypothetical protein